MCNEDTLSTIYEEVYQTSLAPPPSQGRYKDLIPVV